MTRYITRRLLLAIPTLLAVSVILFGLLHLAPGGPMAIYASSRLRGSEGPWRPSSSDLGLRDPIPIQYAKWLEGMVTGDWGSPTSTRETSVRR